MNMNRKINQVNFTAIQKTPKKKRVAAYARVSCGKDAMLHSLAAQVSSYSALIQSRNDWEYVGVYVDEALSGTKDSRDDFQRMLADCRAGKIDIIITKSISRFARNTVTTLVTVRELRSLGIDVYFEEQNIHTLGEEGELVLTLLAAYAEEEARSVSQNIRWHIEDNFKHGLLWSVHMFGFRQVNSKLEVVPEEAELLRMAAEMYLAGAELEEIESTFAEAGAVGRRGKPLSGTRILRILCNEKVVGDVLLQKTFVEDPITKVKKFNNGDRPQYYVKDSHEAIISRETQKRIFEERERRKEEAAYNYDLPFSGRIVCGICGGHCTHRSKEETWVCRNYMLKGKVACDSKAIQESILRELTAEVIGLAEFDCEVFWKKIKEIRMLQNNTLSFLFFDGHIEERRWPEYSRNKDYVLSQGVVCGKCGAFYIHRKNDRTWSCKTHVKKGKAQCDAKPLSEEKLEQLTAEVLGLAELDGKIFEERIKQVRVLEGGVISYVFHDGHVEERFWTPEKRIRRAV